MVINLSGFSKIPSVIAEVALGNCAVKIHDLVEDYKKGKNVFNFFVGSVMKETKGQANPAMTSKIVKEEIEKR